MRCLPLILSMLIALPVGASGQSRLQFSLRDAATELPAWTTRPAAPAVRDLMLHPHMANRAGAVPLSGVLTTQPLHFIGLESYELTRTQTMLNAAGTAGSMGMFVGAVGQLFGMNEKTIWLMTGAAAAAGAAWGTTAGYQDPNYRIRYRWSEPVYDSRR